MDGNEADTEGDDVWEDLEGEVFVSISWNLRLELVIQTSPNLISVQSVHLHVSL